MTDKTALWDRLGKTDPAHTKAFTRDGGFKGTAIKPMWSYRRMTEEFGPCGVGWGVGEPSFHVHSGCNDELLVFCTASVWYRLEATPTPEAKNAGMETAYSAPCTVYGVGGDKVVNKFSYGLKSDDEAFKKAFTDAVTNALKLIGVGADVHMGLFDDNKYVATVRDDFRADTNVAPPPPPKSSASLKRADANGEDAWDRLTKELYQDFLDCKTLDGLAKLRADYRVKAKKARWPGAWLSALANEFDAFEEKLIEEMEKEPV